MARFPLDFIPALSYKGGRRYFGAPRSGGLKHGACDLIAREGTPVYAMADGEVIRGPYHFYHGAYAIEVLHPAFDPRYPNFVIRYCEVAPDAARRGSKVREGQVIAHTKKMHKDAMLHLEMYKGTASGRLTQKHRTPYKRREDLVDPTPYLDQLALKLRLAKALQEPWARNLQAVGASLAGAAASIADALTPWRENEL